MLFISQKNNSSKYSSQRSEKSPESGTRARDQGRVTGNTGRSDYKFGRLNNQTFTKKEWEAKGGMNFSGDRFEKEAHTLASQVISSSQIGKGNGITNNRTKKDISSIASPVLFSQEKQFVSQNSGYDLDSHTKSFMENGFGYNFGNIRVHNYEHAHQAAENIKSLAYTQQNHIVFAKNQYHPHTISGKKLLAHELTHSIQQSNPGNATLVANRVVQRFASEEHQKLGDVATGSATYNLGTPSDKFELTHGDILALSGDVFLSDELFKLASIPGNNGGMKGTRDEIVWALKDTRIWEMRAEKTGANPYAQKEDPRFLAGGIFSAYKFSPEVQNTVFEKYQKLGAANASHFVAPMGRDKTGQPIHSPTGDSAGSKYVKYHEGALVTSDKAGRAGSPVDMAMAADAAAQHYLTDSFSAGHLRTPIASIREYWGNKYPLFWYNLRHKIALDTAIAMVKGQTLITNYRAYTGILAAVEAMAPSLPAVTLGDLVGSVYHDVDNEQGLNIKGGGKVFGDKNMDAATQTLAVDAIKASNKDITESYSHGKTSAPVSDPDLFAAVRKANGGTGTKYAAELAVPEPDKKEPSQNWKAPDINTLWNQKFLGKKGPSVGEVISKRVQGGSIAIQLTSLAAKFPPDQLVPYVNIMLHPQAAYLSGFVQKMQANPKAGVIDIVDWAPHDMWTGHPEAEAVEDLKIMGDAGDKTQNLGGMTHKQRVTFVKALIEDGRPGIFLPGTPSSYDQLIIIFENTNAKERKSVYRDVEGHAWNGNVKEGEEFSFIITATKKGKDVNVMDKARVDKFKKAMKAP